MNIVHRILEYLFYKIQVLTRYMDTSMYLNTHVPFIMSTILLFYLVDVAVIYYYIIMEYSPQKNAANVFLIVLAIMFSLSYLKRHNYKWGFSYIENHLYIDLLLKVQKWFQNATIIALLIPVFLTDLMYNHFCFVAYILLVGMFLGVKLATYTVEYAIYKSKFIGNKGR